MIQVREFNYDWELNQFIIDNKISRERVIDVKFSCSRSSIHLLLIYIV